MIALYVLAFLYIGDEVLLARRVNALFGEGLYSLVGGKVEAGETARQAIRREVLEEVALDIPEASFELVHTFHRNGTDTELVALCFKVDISKMGSPVNAEPNKHDDLRFFNLKQLPENMIPAHKQAIMCIKQNITYSEHGWS